MEQALSKNNIASIVFDFSLTTENQFTPVTTIGEFEDCAVRVTRVPRTVARTS